MKVIGIYPNGICNTVVESGWGRPLKIHVQHCYGDGFKHYKIDERYYWYYAQEQVYQIEDSKTHKIVFVARASNPNDVIEEFNKHRGEITL